MKYSILVLSVIAVMLSSCKDTTAIENSSVIDRITHSSIILDDADFVPFDRDNLDQVFYIRRIHH